MFFSKEKNILGVAFDIGTVSVSATLFEFRVNDPQPHILKTFRSYHKISMKENAAHFSKSTLKQFSGILDDIHAHLEKRSMPTLYHIGLSSIFYLGKTEHVIESWDVARTLTKTSIEEFTEYGKKQFLSGLDRDDVVVFEPLFMRALLNGYVVDSPVGKTAREMELWMHFAATSKELYDAVTTQIQSRVQNSVIRFSTLPVVTWQLMRENLFPEHSAILVDIGGEITEVTFLIEGVIVEVLALPFGVLNILLHIAEAEKIEVANAAALLDGYVSGSLDTPVAARIRAIIKLELRNWEQVFERVWQKASQRMMANIRIFFLGGGALTNDLKDGIVPPLLHPDLARNLNAGIIAPDAFRDKFGTYCCLEGPSDFGLLALILTIKHL